MTKRFSQNFWSPSVPRFASLDSSHRFLGIHRSKKSRFQSLLNLTLQPYDNLWALQVYSFIALQYTLLYINLTFLFDICFWRLLRNFPSIHFQNGHLSILDTFLIFPRYGDPIVHKTEFIKKKIYGFLCQIFERRILRPRLRSTVVLGWEHRTHQTKNEKKHKRKDMQQRCHKWG